MKDGAVGIGQRHRISRLRHVKGPSEELSLPNCDRSTLSFDNFATHDGASVVTFSDAIKQNGDLHRDTSCTANAANLEFNGVNQRSRNHITISFRMDCLPNKRICDFAINRNHLVCRCPDSDCGKMNIGCRPQPADLNIAAYHDFIMINAILTGRQRRGKTGKSKGY